MFQIKKKNLGGVHIYCDWRVDKGKIDIIRSYLFQLFVLNMSFPKLLGEKLMGNFIMKRCG